MNAGRSGTSAHLYLSAEIPLRDDHIIVAGGFDSLTNIVEYPEAVADRLEGAAEKIGGARRVQGATDCGFDTGAGRARVAPISYRA